MSNHEFEIDHETRMTVASEIAAHPERKALANLYSATALCLLAVAFVLVACMPAAIWWAYHAVTP